MARITKDSSVLGKMLPRGCAVCGATKFGHGDVLWQALIDEWQLAPDEATYIDVQQGFHCRVCGGSWNRLVRKYFYTCRSASGRSGWGRRDRCPGNGSWRTSGLFRLGNRREPHGRPVRPPAGGGRCRVEFSEAASRAKAKRARWWEDRAREIALKGGPGGQATMVIFGLKNHAPEDFQEVSRRELTGKDGGPIETAGPTPEERAAEARKLIDETFAEVSRGGADVG